MVLHHGNDFITVSAIFIACFSPALNMFMKYCFAQHVLIRSEINTQLIEIGQDIRRLQQCFSHLNDMRENSTSVKSLEYN